MVKRLKVTREAKEKSLAALELRMILNKNKQFGLDKYQAKQEGVNSGVERAKQLIRSKSISFEDAQSVCRFKRFLPRKRTQKVQGAIDLWGGDDFIQKACDHVEEYAK